MNISYQEINSYSETFDGKSENHDKSNDKKYPKF